jgi:hypothetical protein
MAADRRGGGDQSTNGRTLINSFLEARAGEEHGQVAGGEAIPSPDGVDRRTVNARD